MSASADIPVETVSFVEDPAAFHDMLDRCVALVGPPRAMVWQMPRSAYSPEIVVASVDGALIGAALTSGRPHTAVRKIVDLWRDARAPEGTGAALVGTVVDDARARGLVAVTWQWRPAWEAAPADPGPADQGFVPMGRPYASAPTTWGEVEGAVRWLTPATVKRLPYYGQTMDFTCGAASIIMALEAAGTGRFVTGGAEAFEGNHAREMELWRQATNMPACEPVGLAITASTAWPSADRPGVTDVYLSVDGPVLLESYDGPEAAWRTALQRESWRTADRLGLPIHRRWLPIEEIVALIGRGRRLALLIDEVLMHGATEPHWVLAHSVVGDCVVVEDPWFDVARGESWVDGHALAIPVGDLDRMTRWGDPPYRGVIVLE